MLYHHGECLYPVAYPEFFLGGSMTCGPVWLPYFLANFNKGKGGPVSASIESLLISAQIRLGAICHILVQLLIITELHAVMQSEELAS